MFKFNFPLAMASSLMIVGASSCGQQSGEAQADIIDKPTEVKIEDRHYSVDVLEAFGRVTSPVVSPDGQKIIYSVSYESVEQNKSNNDLYLMNADGSDKKRLTRTPGSEGNAAWIDGGNKIAYIAAKDGVRQIWVMNADGTGAKCISSIENGVEGFSFSPDEKKIVIISEVKYQRTAEDVYPDLPKSTGRIIDDMMYKHWNEWVTAIPHPFLADFDGNSVSNVVDLLVDEPYEAPMKPFGGIESLAWSPDSKKLAYVSRKKTGKEYSLSTNSDIYIYDIESGSTVNLTEGNGGYDTNPAYSPDGKYIAWLSMENDGYESDKNRIFIADVATGEKTDLTSDWDYTATEIAWNTDSKSIYFIAPYLGCCPIFSVQLENKEIKTVAEGTFDYASLAPADESTLVTMRHSMVQPNEVYSVKNGEITKLTDVNDELLAAVDMPTVVNRQVPTTDGKMMTTWVVYPPKFDASKKYPAILYCQGGPQSAVSQFFSYRWNVALMAAQGYIVICPNRRGLPGFGTEWNAQISKDYGGQNMRDYLSAVDDMKKEAYVDGDHIGAVGASYGGFSVYWLAGHHEGRFACLIAHAGIFNMEAQYLETEEMWFANWDMGGAFWEKDNKAAQNTFANSPHRFVDKWTAPILITHGEYDFRILSSQGEMAFNAARLNNVPAEMLIFPDECHWIQKPQNAVLWQRVFFRWLDKWLKGVDYQNVPLYQPAK
ncbi:MAG: S9 family peptidase [Muribaculaceae bacterium]|nr:S9 family peptidase [Muribaculaceae bacterium]